MFKTVMKDEESATAFLAQGNQRFVILHLQDWHQGLTTEHKKSDGNR
jgi:ureidoglycolate hydrolase